MAASMSRLGPGHLPHVTAIIAAAAAGIAHSTSPEFGRKGGSRKTALRKSPCGASRADCAGSPLPAAAEAVLPGLGLPWRRSPAASGKARCSAVCGRPAWPAARRWVCQSQNFASCIQQTPRGYRAGARTQRARQSCTLPLESRVAPGATWLRMQLGAGSIATRPAIAAQKGRTPAASAPPL